MIVRYTALPEPSGSSPRPLLDLALGDVDDVVVPCLVDSGAVHTLLPHWLAVTAGLSLEGAEPRALAVAGTGTHAAFVICRLAAASRTWEAQVGFADPWPYSWGLLGHDAFFRFFTVTFRGADLEFEVEPIA